MSRSSEVQDFLSRLKKYPQGTVDIGPRTQWKNLIYNGCLKEGWVAKEDRGDGIRWFLTPAGAEKLAQIS